MPNSSTVKNMKVSHDAEGNDQDWENSEDEFFAVERFLVGFHFIQVLCHHIMPLNFSQHGIYTSLEWTLEKGMGIYSNAQKFWRFQQSINLYKLSRN